MPDEQSVCESVPEREFVDDMAHPVVVSAVLVTLASREGWMDAELGACVSGLRCNGCSHIKAVPLV